MPKWVIDHGPFGTTDYFIPSDDGDSFTIVTEQDAGPLIDANKDLLNMVPNGARWGDGKMVARIPQVIAQDWHQKGYFKDEKKLKQLLNDPDNRWFRIFPGHI